jgi:ethanolaminephosphotransferase
MTAACGYGSSPLGLFTVLVSCGPMFVSSWEHYHTGILYLGYFNGPCEGIIIACTFMAISGIYGPGFYHMPVNAVFGWQVPDLLIMYHLFVAVVASAFLFVHVPSW